ncbi:hypothetical protein [Paracraurococcus lichenis]|uniref:Uncharacterized protein n=1 Tax=Paracraurococcus lichenis TaxID=3064888 RepID=A0ABT9E8F5_9PROT|nr:hypothetical protein [Paracraurococcus sp. LOR1-02]MDO9712477.1 hypothetical protein [Paracraurococcus sp. LOR1-02]
MTETEQVFTLAMAMAGALGFLDEEAKHAHLYMNDARAVLARMKRHGCEITCTGPRGDVQLPQEKQH